MALKVWTFLLVMSLPAAERGHGFGSLAAVLSNIDYHRIQQNPYYYDGGIGNASAALQWTPRRPPPSPDDDDPASRRMGKRSAPKILNKNKKHHQQHHNHYAAASSAAQSEDGRCMARVQSKLADMMSAAAATASAKGHRRQNAAVSLGYMDLSGYALHQRLRTAPGAEMYVTGMRAKVLPPRDPSGGAADSSYSPSGDEFGDRSSWARVDECRYDPTGNTLEARMRFGRPLAVSGSVRLLYGGNSVRLPGETGCDMTLRLRPRAGLGFTAAPMTMPEKSPPNRLTATAPMTIRTTATFIDPEPADEAADPAAAYVSVHSYNCVGGAAATAGQRERPSAAAAESTDRFEQFASAEDEAGQPSLSSAVDAEFDIDLDKDDNDDGFGDSAELLQGDKRSGGRRPSAAATSAPSAAPAVAPAAAAPAPVAPAADPAIRPFGPAGFVTMAAVPGPEPRLRRIQYHGSRPQYHYLQQQNQQQQHPLLSVHAPSSPLAPSFNPPHHHHQQPQDQAHDHLLMEMEEVFVRGVRSLLAKHMERTLQPVLKDSLMVNMGYTVSYG